MKSIAANRNKKGILVSMTIISLLFLGVGTIGMRVLADMKVPPPEKAKKEKSIPVETMRVKIEDVPTRIVAFGEVKPLTVVPISPEIGGRVVAVHPHLESGKIIQRNELLIRIDAKDYDIALGGYLERLKYLKRNRELSFREYKRLKNLYQNSEAGTLSRLEMAERAYNSVCDGVSQLEQAIELAELSKQRTEIKSPFTCRVISVDVEKDQYVAPGIPIAMIADDSALEVLVSMDSAKAKRLLRFDPDATATDRFWFSGLEQVSCGVYWTQDEKEVCAQGFLDRIVSFDSRTRTLKVAVRLRSDRGSHTPIVSFPIVDGMFCKVTIPGRIVRQVIKLPREVVGRDNTVRTVHMGRLKTVRVGLLDYNEAYALVNSGLAADDVIILTQLANPMENSLVELSEPKLIAQGEVR